MGARFLAVVLLFVGAGGWAAPTKNLADPQYTLGGDDYKQEASAINQMMQNTYVEARYLQSQITGIQTASSLLPSTNTWSGGNTFTDRVTISSTLYVTANAPIPTGQQLSSPTTAGMISMDMLPSAWVTFNGVAGSTAILAGVNVSSVTRVGTGDYRVNFARPMSDANYFPVCLCLRNTTSDAVVGFVNNAGNTNWNTTSIEFDCMNLAGTGVDASKAGCMIFGGR